MRGPGRTNAHNAVRDELYRLASYALMSPEKESMCFPASQQRMDLVLRRGFGGVAQLLDVAITHPLRADVLMRAVRDGPDVAATLYEEVKYTTYGQLIAPASQVFTPVVFDTLGGTSINCRGLLSTIATAYGRRAPEGMRFGRLQFAARLHGTLIREIARLVAVAS